MTRPSVYLRRALDGGTGFELDDLISGHEGNPAFDDVIDAVIELMLRNDDQALRSTSAREALRDLAEKLEREGR